MPRTTRQITPEIARAAGRDEGNRHAAANGRTAWNEDDWNVAAAMTARLLGASL